MSAAWKLPSRVYALARLESRTAVSLFSSSVEAEAEVEAEVGEQLALWLSR